MKAKSLHFNHILPFLVKIYSGRLQRKNCTFSHCPNILYRGYGEVLYKGCLVIIITGILFFIQPFLFHFQYGTKKDFMEILEKFQDSKKKLDNISPYYVCIP